MEARDAMDAEAIDWTKPPQVRVDLGGIGWAESLNADDEPEFMGQLVPLGDRMVAARIRVVLFGDDQHPEVRLIIDSRSGVPRCASLQFSPRDSGGAVRQADVRALDLETVIEQVVPRFVTTVVRTSEGREVMALRDPNGHHDSYRDTRTIVRAVKRQARRRVTDELLEAVAAAYRGHPDRPAQAVEAALGVSRSSAFRYIAEARARGILTNDA